MTLAVFTARISSVDPDKLDVTRGSGGAHGLPFAPTANLLRLAKRGWIAFQEYEPRYLAEMRVSYRMHRAAWDALLARPRVVLCCYCTDPNECHRSLLASVLGKLGAEVKGEIGLDEALRAVADHRASEPRFTVRDFAAVCVRTGVEPCVLAAVLEAKGTMRRGVYKAIDKQALRGLLDEARAALPRAS